MGNKIYSLTGPAFIVSYNYGCVAGTMNLVITKDGIDYGRILIPCTVPSIEDYLYSIYSSSYLICTINGIQYPKCTPNLILNKILIGGSACPIQLTTGTSYTLDVNTISPSSGVGTLNYIWMIGTTIIGYSKVSSWIPNVAGTYTISVTVTDSCALPQSVTLSCSPVTVITAPPIDKYYDCVSNICKEVTGGRYKNDTTCAGTCTIPPPPPPPPPTSNVCGTTTYDPLTEFCFLDTKIKKNYAYMGAGAFFLIMMMRQ